LKNNFDENQIISKLNSALIAIAKISYIYSIEGSDDEEILDVDDYIQTILIGESLVANHGFNHKDLVRRYRTRPGHIIGGRRVAASGISSWYRGQIKKLIDSQDIEFRAVDGITSGSAMKVACIAAFYALDMDELFVNTDRITRITHESVDARLAALMTTLRYRQIFLGIDSSVADLREALISAKQKLKINDSEFFFELFDVGASLVDKFSDPVELLIELNRVVGLSHLATSVPISACLWTFCPIDPSAVLNHWTLFDRVEIHTGSSQIMHSDWNYVVHRQRYINLGYSVADSRLLDTPPRSHFDLDTFFSIALSMLAAKNGVGNLVSDSELHEFTDNLYILSKNIVEIGSKIHDK
jgi:hypothetical protein